VLVEARGEREELLPRGAESTVRHEVRRLVAANPPDRARDRVAVEVRELEVDDRGVGMRQRDRFERVDAVRDVDDDMA